MKQLRLAKWFILYHNINFFSRFKGNLHKTKLNIVSLWTIRYQGNIGVNLTQVFLSLIVVIVDKLRNRDINVRWLRDHQKYWSYKYWRSCHWGVELEVFEMDCDLWFDTICIYYFSYQILYLKQKTLQNNNISMKCIL